MTVGELDVLLYEDIKLSRPTSAEQRYAAIRYGCRRLTDLIRRVRPEWLLLERQITIPAGQIRLDLSALGAIRRIKQIVALGQGVTAQLAGAGVPLATTREIIFEYRSVESADMMRALRVHDTDSGVVYFDLIFPTDVPVLAFAPPQLTSCEAIVYYYEEPPRFLPAASNVALRTVYADRETLIRAWAMEWLLRTVNDVEASAWRDIAGALAVEATDDIGWATDGQSEVPDTGLDLGDI